MIKPSSTEVQNIAILTVQGIEKDLGHLSSSNLGGYPISEYEVIQLHIERLLTETIRGFEVETAKLIRGANLPAQGGS